MVSARWYASHREILSNTEALRRRIPARGRRTTCRMRLKSTKIWMDQRFQRSSGLTAIALAFKVVNLTISQRRNGDVL
jgi:hypothetical protein